LFNPDFLLVPLMRITAAPGLRNHHHTTNRRHNEGVDLLAVHRKLKKHRVPVRVGISVQRQSYVKPHVAQLPEVSRQAKWSRCGLAASRFATSPPRSNLPSHKQPPRDFEPTTNTLGSLCRYRAWLDSAKYQLQGPGRHSIFKPSPHNPSLPDLPTCRLP
jgi:hypothetical protein